MASTVVIAALWLLGSSLLIAGLCKAAKRGDIAEITRKENAE
jgi:hypothetical protein